MNKIDSLYSFLLNTISEICGDGSDLAERYWEGLSAEKKPVFEQLQNKFADEKKLIEDSKVDDDVNFYQNYDDLLSICKDFNSNFSNFNNFCYLKMYLIIKFSEVIFSKSSKIPNEDITTDLIFKKCCLGFDSKAHITNLKTAASNIVWFNPCSQDSIDELVNFDADLELWYSLLLLSSDFDYTTGSEIIIADKKYLTENEKGVVALLKLHMASSGKKITPVLDYLEPPNNSSIQKFDPSNYYSQFDEIIHILGEYNNRKDVLSKFISIYHIVENFMYRYPIVKLEQSNSGKLFSIRDFKRLYREVDISEESALENIVRESLKLNFISTPFLHFVHKMFHTFITKNSSELDAVENTLKKLQISKSKIAKISQGDFSAFFSKLIYKIRCSIIHNKETEYHISSVNYDRGCELLLERFLLPAMEEFVFHLLCEHNTLVWYNSDKLKLWEKI